MTKRHFIALADAAREFIGRKQTNYDETLKDYVSSDLFTPEQRGQIIRFLADFCSDQNPRFDHHRWVNYLAGECGPNGGKVAHNG